MGNVKVNWFFATEDVNTLDKYLAIAHGASPYIDIYDFSTILFPVRIPDPATLPTGPANWVDWRPQSTTLAVAHNTSPFVTWYLVESNVATKIANPATLPLNNGSKVAWSSDGKYCAVGCVTGGGNQTWFIYDFTSGSPVEIGTVPAFLSGVINLSWRPGTYLLNINDFIYDVTSGTPVLAHTLTGINGLDSSWTVDGRYLTHMGSNSPFIRSWDWDTGSPVQEPNPAVLPPSTGRSPSYDPVNTDKLNTVHSHVGVSPGNDSTRYDWVAGVLTNIADMTPEPSVSGGGSPSCIRTRNDGSRFAISTSQSAKWYLYDNTVDPPSGLSVPTPLPAGQPVSVAWGGQDALTATLEYDFVMWNSDRELQAYAFDGTDITTVGNATAALTLASADRGGVSGLTASSVIVAGSDGFNDKGIASYQFVGADWVQDGNEDTGNPNSFIYPAAMTPTLVCIDDFTRIRAYDFDGTDWDQTGNDAPKTFQSIDSRSATTVVGITSTNSLGLWTWADPNWTGSKGTALGFSGQAMCCMTTSRVAVYDQTNHELKTYDEGVSSYSLVGNAFSLPNSAQDCCLTALSATRVVMGFATSNELRVYDFDGTDWSQVGNTLTSQPVPEGDNLASGSYLLI